MATRDIARRRETNRIAQQRYYSMNKALCDAKAIKRTRERMRELQGLLNSMRASTPCGTCGIFLPFCAMQFDHVVRGKKFNVSEAPKRGIALETAFDEIMKCQIVCSNCHSIRTFIRRSGFSPS